MKEKSGKGFSAARLAELGAFYRKHLLEVVMPFWEARTRDGGYGGYLTGLDMAGNVTNPNKYMWTHGRQLWMFSALYNRVEKRQSWLDLARWGRDFIVKHAYAGNGRWHYKLDRAGNMKKGTISGGTDQFILSGLCEYAVATGSDEDLTLIRDTFDASERNSHDPNFKDVYHGTWDPDFKGRPMLSVHVCGLAEPILGPERVRPWMKEAIHDILYTFSLDEYKANFEQLTRDGRVVDHPRVRTLNPGHTLEALWFCMDESRRLGDSSIIPRAVEVADWTWNRGHDDEYGGLFAYVDLYGGAPAQMAYHKHTDQLWDDKSWWVHCESLVTLAIAALETGDPKWAQRFEEQHEYCQKHFYAPQYSEWYPSLWRDGRPKIQDHGQAWKCAYHLPRALLMLMLRFEEAAKKKG
jgi:N-acylglucosamine 2-epimerase